MGFIMQLPSAIDDFHLFYHGLLNCKYEPFNLIKISPIISLKNKRRAIWKKIAKIHWRLLKNQETADFNQTWCNTCLGERIQVWSNEEQRGWWIIDNVSVWLWASPWSYAKLPPSTNKALMYYRELSKRIGKTENGACHGTLHSQGWQIMINCERIQSC